MKPRISLILPIFILAIVHPSFGQSNRAIAQNNIGWYNYFGTFKASKTIDIHTEYQWRRNNLITDWQQSLLRLGINYHLNPRILFRLGYARIETYPYGTYSINEFGKQFTENRAFQMVQLSHKEKNINFFHRFLFEQRFIGMYSTQDKIAEDYFIRVNRARYLFRLQMPLHYSNSQINPVYIAFFNEVFVNFGQNVVYNIFDQNRFSILLGYRFHKNITVEGGYLNQTKQFGRLVGNRPIIQYNNGLIINAYLNMDLTKQEATKRNPNETE